MTQKKTVADINKIQEKWLAPKIKLIKKMSNIDQQPMYSFYLKVQRLNIVQIQSDFTGSQNCIIKGTSKNNRIVTQTVQPFQQTQTLIAQVQLNPGWKLATKFILNCKPVTKERQLQQIRNQVDNLSKDQQNMATVLKYVNVYQKDISEINEILQTRKCKFIDLEFPPNFTSIVDEADKNLIDDTIEHWRRPCEFLETEEYYMIDRFNYTNLKIGKLHDNAFFSVVVTLTIANQSLIDSLFFNDNTMNPYGFYKLKICKNGEWQTVVVDDLIPCEPMAGPKFITTKLKEIWIHLLQKAYAKLHKRYIVLHDLEVSDVFNDLTGCPTYIEEMNQKNIFRIIDKNLADKNVVVLYNTQQIQHNQDQFTPLKNYAYPVLGSCQKKVDEQDDHTKLHYKLLLHTHEQLQIWADELPLKFRYMCVCHIRNWEEVRIKGKFITVDTGKTEDPDPIAMSRWYYSLNLPSSCDMHITLHQEDMLIGNNQHFKKYVYCSLLMLQKSEREALKPIVLKRYSHNRQFSFYKQLEKGSYFLVPFINSQPNIGKAPKQQDMISDIFNKLDLFMRRELNYNDLVPFFKVCNQMFRVQQFEKLLKYYYKGQKGNQKGIRLREFQAMWNEKSGKQGQQVQLNKLKWQNSIKYYEKQRLFILSIHSNIQIHLLIKSNIGTDLDNNAHCQLLQQVGQEINFIDKNYSEYIKFKFYQSKSLIIQYMIQNKYKDKLLVQIDFRESEGYVFIPKSGVVKEIIGSGQKLFIMKLIPHQKMEKKNLVRKQIIKKIQPPLL